MAQPDLEGAVEVGGFGYPAMVVLRYVMILFGLCLESHIKIFMEFSATRR